MEKKETEVLSKMLQDYKNIYRNIIIYVDSKKPIELSAFSEIETKINNYLREIKKLRASEKEVKQYLLDSLQNKYVYKSQKDVETNIAVSILMTNDMINSIINSTNLDEKKKMLSKIFTYWNEISERVKSEVLKIKYLNDSNNCPDCARNILMHLTRVNIGLYDNIGNVTEIKNEMERIYKAALDNKYKDLDEQINLLKPNLEQISNEVNSYYNEYVLEDDKEKTKILTSNKEQ